MIESRGIQVVRGTHREILKQDREIVRETSRQIVENSLSGEAFLTAVFCLAPLTIYAGISKMRWQKMIFKENYLR